MTSNSEEPEVNLCKKCPKPKIICFDVHGTVTKWSFNHKILIPYLKQYAKYYAETNFENSECQQLIEKLRKGQSTTGGPSIPKDGTKEEICNALDAYVNYCTDNFLESEGYIMYRFAVWFDGFTEGRIATPMYADVAIQIQKWRCNLGLKLFVISNGWSVATKKFFQHTNNGDLTILIEKFFDSQTLGDLTKESSLKKFLTTVGQHAEDVILLTKNPDTAKAARAIGINGILVASHRKNIEELENIDGIQNLPVIRSFNELQFE